MRLIILRRLSLWLRLALRLILRWLLWLCHLLARVTRVSRISRILRSRRLLTLRRVVLRLLWLCHLLSLRILAVLRLVLRRLLVVLHRHLEDFKYIYIGTNSSLSLL